MLLYAFKRIHYMLINTMKIWRKSIELYCHMNKHTVCVQSPDLYSQVDTKSHFMLKINIIIAKNSIYHTHFYCRLTCANVDINQLSIMKVLLINFHFTFFLFFFWKRVKEQKIQLMFHRFILFFFIILNWSIFHCHFEVFICW